MTATLTVHLRGHQLDPDWPPALQVASLEAEIEACHVFQRAANYDLAILGDIRAVARLAALDDHEAQLRTALSDLGRRH